MGRPSSIRAKVTLASTLISAIAMLAIVVTTSFVTQSVLSRSISNTLESHLDALQVELAAGAVNLSIEGTGAELIQAVDADGEIIASSDWAWGVSAMTDGVAPGKENRARHGQVHLTRGAAPAWAGGESLDVSDDSEAADSGGGGGALGEASGRKRPTSTNVYDTARGDDDRDDDSDDERDDDGRDDDDGDPDDGDDDVGRGKGPNRRGGDVAGFENAESPSLPPLLSAMFAPSPAFAAEPDSDAVADAQLISASSLLGTDGPFIVIERGIETPNGPVTMAAMASVASAVEASHAIALILGGIMVFAIACVAVLSWTMASRTLQPVAEMRSRVDDINASDLSLRIPVPQGDPDLASLAATFNCMLARVEAALIEQRRFISDASHELKSPVAATRIMLESAQSHPELIDQETLLADLSYENERMGGIVGNLLLLAQRDESCLKTERRPLDLCDLLFEEAAALRARSPLTVDSSGVEPVVCVGDSSMIRRAVRNLLDNAARYAKTVVKVSCREEAGRVLIVVSDDGPGVSEADRERIFGRFVRLEEDRGRKQGSTGLGLAVVKTIAEDHGGTARFVDSECGGATVEFEFSAE